MSLSVFVRVIIFLAAVVLAMTLSAMASVMILRNLFEWKDRKNELRGIEGTVLEMYEKELFEVIGIGAMAYKVLIEDNRGYRMYLWDVFNDVVISKADSGIFIVRGDTITGFERFSTEVLN